MGGGWDDPDKVLTEMKRESEEKRRVEQLSEPFQTSVPMSGTLPPGPYGVGLPAPPEAAVTFNMRNQSMSAMVNAWQAQMDTALASQLRGVRQQPAFPMGTLGGGPVPQQDATDALQSVLAKARVAEERRVLIPLSSLEALEARIADLEARIWDE